MNNITRNIEASNVWLKNNRKNAKPIVLEEVEKRLKKGNFLGTENSKTKKGDKDGYLTGILYLAPHKITGFNFCPNAVTCVDDCLFNTGRGAFNTVTRARIIKTLCFLLDRETFIYHINKDITRLQKRAKKINYELSIRLNGTSDININKYFGHIISKKQDVNFYDYTKILPFITKNKHSNYNITFSFDGLNWDNCIKALQHGSYISVVFLNDIPKTYKGYKVIDGDLNDLRFLDYKKDKNGNGLIVALKYKGSKKNLKNDIFVIKN